MYEKQIKYFHTLYQHSIIQSIMSLIGRISGDFRHLCKPAIVHLAISVVVLIGIAYQNMGLNNMYCMGSYSCYVPSTAAVIFCEGIYIMFWTWILHLMCRTGYASISWFLVVFPILLFFVLIGLMMLVSLNYTRSGRVQKMLPIEQPVLAPMRVNLCLFIEQIINTNIR